jgi:hypothetical protein
MLAMGKISKLEGFFLAKEPTKILESSMFSNKKIKFFVNFHMEKTKKTSMNHPKNLKLVKS